MIKVGLTGGIGSGKTTTTHLFQKLGVPVIDADIIARQVVEPNTSAYEAIVRHFGAHVLDENKNINRTYLRNIIFADQDERRWLESLLHPLIRKRMQKEAEQFTTPYCIFSIALLAESKNIDFLDHIIVVDIDPKLQLKRGQERDKHNTTAIIESQSSRTERLKIADDIIDNNGSIEDLSQQVNALHKKLLALAH